MTALSRSTQSDARPLHTKAGEAPRCSTLLPRPHHQSAVSIFEDTAPVLPSPRPARMDITLPDQPYLVARDTPIGKRTVRASVTGLREGRHIPDKAATRRVILSAMKVAAPNAVLGDIAGRATGKENMCAEGQGKANLAKPSLEAGGGPVAPIVDASRSDFEETLDGLVAAFMDQLAL